MNIFNSVFGWGRQTSPRNPTPTNLEDLNLRELADLPPWHECAEQDEDATH